MRYCLTDTGLGANASVTAINEYAFVGCAYLADIGLGTSERIVAIGNFACEACKSLRLTNPETNTTISSLGKSCFKNTDIRGGLDLPKGLKITQIPQEAFRKTQHVLAMTLAPTITGGGAVSIISNGIDQGSEYVTCPDKIVMVVCSYDSSEHALGHWRSEEGALVLSGLSGETGTKTVEQQNVLPTDQKAQFLIALLLAHWL